MSHPHAERPYLETWLRRIGRQFAVSGRLSQTAHLLAAQEGGTAEQWRARLRRLLAGEELPSVELLTRIDVLLSGGQDNTTAVDDAQGRLF